MCRTFSLPEIKRADLFAAAAKAANVLDAAAASDAQFQQQGVCYDAGSWSDEDLMDLLNNFPDELEMDIDFSSGSSDDVGSSNTFADDSSVDHQSLSSEDTVAASLTSNSSLASNIDYNNQHMRMPMVNLPTYDFGSVHYGLMSPEEGFVALPSPKSFAHLSMKTPALLREEKLNVLDPFIGALNEGDLFSLFSICQSLCAPTVAFHSTSCGFSYSGPLSVMSFWTLLFEEHYQGRIQCLSRRLNSTLRNNNSRKSQHQYQTIGESSLFESVDFVLKLEGCRLSEFRSFELFQALMNSGCVHDNLSLPEMISIAEAFYKEYQTTMSPSHQIFNMVYLFEVNLKFHALHHTIAQWNFELIAVQCNN